MKSNKFILVLIAVAFIGCKREIVSPSSINNSSNENISADVLTTANEAYGNWLKFKTRAEFTSKINEISSLYSNSSNPDSVLNLFDLANEFISLRQSYADTTRVPVESDTTCYITSSVFSSVINKNGIYEINDTIYVESPNNTFIITDGNEGKLSAVMGFFNVVHVNKESLPADVNVVRIYKKDCGLTLEEIQKKGDGYDHSFTRADEHKILGTQYKTVAVVHDFARPNFVLYAFETKYEKGIKKHGVWRYNSFPAHWLHLQVETFYNVNYRFYTRQKYYGVNITNYDKSIIYAEAFSYTNYLSSFLPSVYVESLQSTHQSHIHSTTKQILIFETGF